MILHQHPLNEILDHHRLATAVMQTSILEIWARVEARVTGAVEVQAAKAAALLDPGETWTRCSASRYGLVIITGFFHRSSVLQCGEKGHYANPCRNRNVPGNRGGVERAPKRYDEQ